jgi:ketosteroid isomerase-like protein
MHPNAQLIQSFYTSFQNLDAEGMKKCYHPNIQFSDPVFPSLQGKEAGAMWAMLIGNLGKNKDGWRLECRSVQATETEGSCHWEAYYTFSATGRQVHNIIDACFVFQDGLIVQHTDSFDFYRWARMAFGWTGILLGWTPFFNQKVQARVNGLLSKYMEKTN